jgi:hypothetical protein
MERFNGGAAMERSGDGLNWRSQAPKPSRRVVAEFGGAGCRSRRILQRLVGVRG